MERIPATEPRTTDNSLSSENESSGGGFSLSPPGFSLTNDSGDTPVQRQEAPDAAAAALDYSGIARRLHNAMHGTFFGTGWGTDEQAIYDNLALLNNDAAHIDQLKAQYQQMFGQALEADLRSELSNSRLWGNQLDRALAYLTPGGGSPTPSPSPVTPDPEPSTPSGDTQTPTTDSPTTDTPTTDTPVNAPREADSTMRPHMYSSNEDNRVGHRWINNRGDETGHVDEFNEELPGQIEAFFGEGYTLERVQQEIQEATEAGNTERAEELRVLLWNANMYSVVESLDVDTEDMYQPGGGNTYCNIYAYDVVTAMGGYLPRVWWTSEIENRMIEAVEAGQEFSETVSIYGSSPNTVREMNANALTAWMDRIGQNYFGWDQADDMRAAQEAANSGYLVIILAANANPARSGHVNVILPETEQHTSEDRDGDFIPLQSQAGSNNFKYRASSSWWDNASHTNGHAWIARGQMDSPFLTPDQLGGASDSGVPASGETDTPDTSATQTGNQETAESSETEGGTAATTPTADSPIATGTVTAGGLNVRSGPGANNPTVRDPLSNGAEVNIYEEQNGWYRIGENEWISGRFVERANGQPIVETSTAAATPDPATQPEVEGDATSTSETPTPGSPIDFGYVTASSLNVRSGPSADNERVGDALPRSTRIDIYEERDGWYRIGDGQWVSGAHVRRGELTTAPAGSTKPNWISVAEAEVGQREIVGDAAHNPRVVEYHSTTGGWANDEVPWCASFVNWVMEQSGQGGNGSAWAQSWATYGQQLDRPAYGSIAVFRWSADSGHVGFVVGMEGDRIMVLGGNQDNSVNISSYNTGSIIAYTVPEGYEVPEAAYNMNGSSVEAEEGSVAGTR